MSINNPVSHMMTKSVHTAALEDSVEHVKALLAEHRISSLPVIDAEGKVFGIISNSDLLRSHRNHENPKALHAWEICTHRPICVGPDASVREVAEIMVNNKVHHVVVCDKDKVVGFVSAFDYVNKFVLRGIS